MTEGAAFFLFLAVGAAALFSFLAVAAWAGSRHAERTEYYRTELVRKAAESPSSAPVLEFLLERDRETDRRSARRIRFGIRLGGLVATAAGIGLMVFLQAVEVDRPVFLVGVMPVLVGVTLFSYSFFGPKE